MAEFIEETIELIWSPPRGVKRQHRDRKHPDNFQYYRQWGFTIYRTYYGPDSNRYWNMLLGALKQQTRLALGFYENNKHVKEDIDQSDVQRLKDLFCLNVREDASVLDGVDVQGIREFCQNEESDTDRSMADPLFHFVLLADEMVFKDIIQGEFVVKAVALNWEEGRTGCGWMRIPTGYLLQLWQTLMQLTYDTYKALPFEGPEQDLAAYVWPGELSIMCTGKASEVRPWHAHYSSQYPDRSGF
ncbi:hypothetical protein ACHAPJ_009699 [Fusarium lateritium]